MQAAFITTTAALGYASVLGVWYYGGLLVVRGQMTTGDLVAFATVWKSTSELVTAMAWGA